MTFKFCQMAVHGKGLLGSKLQFRKNFNANSIAVERIQATKHLKRCWVFANLYLDRMSVQKRKDDDNCFYYLKKRSSILNWGLCAQIHWIRGLIIVFISFALFFWKKRYEAAAKHSITLQRLCGKKQAKIRHLIGLHFIDLHHPMFMWVWAAPDLPNHRRTYWLKLSESIKNFTKLLHWLSKHHYRVDTIMYCLINWSIH